MNKIPEGLKFFMDPRRKKLKENNVKCSKRNVERENKTPQIIPDVFQNSCFYCAKVFINSNYLLKHILRRHSEEVVNFHKKFSQSDPCDLKNLFTFLEAEFSELKNDIFAVKQAVGLEGFKQDKEKETSKRSKESDRFPAKVSESSGVVKTDPPSNEVYNLENKLKNIEDKVQLLCDKLEENDRNMNSKFLLKQDIHQYFTHKEEKILRKQEVQFVEMRQVLLNELRSVLDKRLHENNVDWNCKITELKDDILKLDQALATVKKQINSPEYLQVVEKKLESKIFHFLDNIGQTAMKRKNMKPKINSSPKIQALEKTTSESQVSLKHNLPGLNHSLEEPRRNLNITPEKLRVLIAEKLSSFGIFSNTSRITNSEYEEKMRLVNTNKDYLKMLYHNFSEVYNCINSSADQRVLSNLKPKQKRKLRFSDPLILNKNMSSNLMSNRADFLDRTCPVSREKINYLDTDKSLVSPKPAVAVPKSEGFMFKDESGSGDFCDKFQEDYRDHVKIMFDKTEGQRFHTSSPVTEATVKKPRNTFALNSSSVESSESSSEDKNIFDTPDKRSSDIILDDEASFNKTYVKDADVWDKISDEEESLKSLSSLDDDSFANNPIK